MDADKGITNKYINKWVLAVLCGCIVFTFMSVFLISEIQSGRQKDELALSITYSAFQNEVVSIINKDITLLKGYLTYIEVNGLSEEISEIYLDRLTGSNTNFYRNITVIKDTTINWIYPIGGNEDAIGVDLAEVSGQADKILLVKEKRQPIVDGPVDLVQGGKGYIVRLPVVKTDGTYWGQLSIVLDADKITKEIKEIAKHNGVEINIETKDGKSIIYNEEVLNSEPLYFDLEEKDFDWQIAIIPVDGWDSNLVSIIVIVLVSLMFSFGLSYIVFYGISTNENLKILASKDSLTNLYNRYFLEEYQALILSRADRYRRTVGFILLDLDRFKNINDTYGHKIGDEVLKLTAEILEAQTRVNEAAFRLGGDEFLVVFPDLKSVDELHIVESRLSQAFSKKFVISGHEIRVTPSIGIGVYPRDGAGFDQVLHEADSKMYKSKESKK